ncbi:hypothetical protein ANCDUO_01439 [Ancylostoma duodenale]|uniref:Uncharacterized protein n=1 Tax=Ancylostoma duodenale TaxID=51022 RepID=A0A0C2DYW3_9BILA|nr:hypothetical protein ANCDUO_01439 [Ancylostoma duodenale]
MKSSRTGLRSNVKGQRLVPISVQAMLLAHHTRSLRCRFEAAHVLLIFHILTAESSVTE